MLAKRTAKNQVTLPKSIVQAVGDSDYYDVSTENGRIVLTPVRIQQADLVRQTCRAGYYRSRYRGCYHLGKKTSMTQPPRVVLDTNCLISALLFSKGQLSRLRHAWQNGRYIPVVSRAKIVELLRVLSYPKFKLNRTEQETLPADFLPYAETVVVEIPDKLPMLRDPDDKIFLQLAVCAKTDALVSGDKDILAAKHQLGAIPILTVAEFAAYLAD